MKKFIIKTFILSILLIVFVWLIILIPLPENSFDLAIIDKQQILANTKSPRIVLAGGSNIGFGIDSEAIQHRFHVPVVNMGVHASFGLGRILAHISPFLQAGDILLVIPEYDHFTSVWNGYSVAYELIFDARQYRLLWSPYYGLPKSFPVYASMHIKALQDIILPFQKNINSESYTRDGFNEYGDYVKHLGMANKIIVSNVSLYPLNKSYLKHFFKFVDDLTSRGIVVVLSYPSYEEQSFQDSNKLIQELDTIFRENENLQVISTPESYCFPTNYFYDTFYHLNRDGRAVRTEQLVSDLQASGLLPVTP